MTRYRLATVIRGATIQTASFFGYLYSLDREGKSTARYCFMAKTRQGVELGLFAGMMQDGSSRGTLDLQAYQLAQAEAVSRAALTGELDESEPDELSASLELLRDTFPAAADYYRSSTDELIGSEPFQDGTIPTFILDRCTLHAETTVPEAEAGDAFIKALGESLMTVCGLLRPMDSAAVLEQLYEALPVALDENLKAGRA